MYVTIVHGPNRPVTVYGPIDERYPSAAPGLIETATNLPLHPADLIVRVHDLVSRVRRVSRTTAHAIATATATPVADQTDPAVLFLVEREAGLVVAIGPISTAEMADRWLRERRGLPGDGLRCARLPLVAPVTARATENPHRTAPRR